MRFVQLTPDFSEVWDKLVYASDDAWLYHLYDWLQLTENIWDLESKSFLVEHDGEIVGVFPLQIHKKSRVLRSLFMGTGGAAVANTVDQAFRNKVMKGIYEHAEEIAHEIRAPSIEIYLPPLAKSSLKNRWGINPLVRYFYEDISTHTWMVNLTRNGDDIFVRLSKDARQSIKRALKAGYRVRELQSPYEIDEYYRVHCETYHRTGVNPHPEAYFQGIYEHVCKKGCAKIWKALEPNGSPVAFEIIGLFKEGAVYWAGCCETEHLDSGVNYLLQYNSMLWAKSNGAKWFENGEAFPNIRGGKLRGLTTFKEKFGGELHRFYKGSITFDTKVARRTVFENWLKDTELLLQPLLGTRSANLVTKPLRKCGYFAAKTRRRLGAILR